MEEWRKDTKATREEGEEVEEECILQEEEGVNQIGDKTSEISKTKQWTREQTNQVIEKSPDQNISVNPNKKTAQQIILQTPAELYFVQPHNKAIFNLADTKHRLPKGSYSLFGLGLKAVSNHGVVHTEHPIHAIDLTYHMVQFGDATKQE